MDVLFVVREAESNSHFYLSGLACTCVFVKANRELSRLRGIFTCSYLSVFILS